MKRKIIALAIFLTLAGQAVAQQPLQHAAPPQPAATPPKPTACDLLWERDRQQLKLQVETTLSQNDTIEHLQSDKAAADKRIADMMATIDAQTALVKATAAKAEEAQTALVQAQDENRRLNDGLAELRQRFGEPSDNPTN
jgi:hypothetical protein